MSETGNLRKTAGTPRRAASSPRWLARGIQCRRGLATLEVVMFLPILCVFIILIFMTAGAGMSVVHVAVKARNQAWEGRDEPWRSNGELFKEGLLVLEEGRDREDLEVVGKPIHRYFADNEALPRGWNATRGLVRAESWVEIPFVPKGVQDRIRFAGARHAVLGGCWDHRELPFEDYSLRREHRRLEIPEKFDYYGKSVDLNGFERLAEFGPRGG